MRQFSKILFSLMMAVGLVGCRPATTSTSSTSTPEPTSTAPTVLRVGMECAYAPNNWEESKASSTNLPIENNPRFYAEGYDVQIAKLIGEQLNAEIVIVKLAWDGLIQALNAGTIDMIIAGMMDTSERKQAIDFSKTYGIGETIYTIMTKKTSTYTGKRTLNDFANASILG